MRANLLLSVCRVGGRLFQSLGSTLQYLMQQVICRLKIVSIGTFIVLGCLLALRLTVLNLYANPALPAPPPLGPHARRCGLQSMVFADDGAVGGLAGSAGEARRGAAAGACLHRPCAPFNLSPKILTRHHFRRFLPRPVARVLFGLITLAALPPWSTGRIVLGLKFSTTPWKAVATIGNTPFKVTSGVSVMKVAG